MQVLKLLLCLLLLCQLLLCPSLLNIFETKLLLLLLHEGLLLHVTVQACLVLQLAWPDHDACDQAVGVQPLLHLLHFDQLY